MREAHIAVGMIIRAVHEPPLRRGASQERAVATGAEPSHTPAVRVHRIPYTYARRTTNAHLLMTQAKISASLLGADFGHLADSVAAVEAAGIDEIHFDMMDGRFVPNISFGEPVLEAVNGMTELPIDVHMMLHNPDLHVPRVADAGADIMTVHVETTTDISWVVDVISQCGVRPAVAFSPDTPVSEVRRVADRVDRILVMTVEPGFGGQSFLRETLTKLPDVLEIYEQLGYGPPELAVDGGINPDTIGLAAVAGATTFISGSAIFGHPDGIAAGLAAERAAIGR